MQPIKSQIAKLCATGYTEATAQAKVIHDTLLLAISRSGLKPSSTIKGGVVMSSLTNDIRRATMDMDLDFIRYPLGNASISKFIVKLQKSFPEVQLKMIGEPIDLKHDDYHGKRIYVAIKDDSISRWIRTKLDIGVHTHNDIDQVDISFATESGLGSAQLQANPVEQIFAEKLLSLLRHGVNSNRPKDIFDMHYLSHIVHKPKLMQCINDLIYENTRCKINDHNALMKAVELTFSMKVFRRKLQNTRVNWTDTPSDEALTSLSKFIGTLT